jgi:UPF0716 family protein affecting phage T7 exclusion
MRGIWTVVALHDTIVEVTQMSHIMCLGASLARSRGVKFFLNLRQQVSQLNQVCGALIGNTLFFIISTDSASPVLVTICCVGIARSREL